MKFLENILDYIWPQFCLGCRREGSLFCDDCQKNWQVLTPDPHPWKDVTACRIPCYVCLDYAENNVKQVLTAFKYGFIKKLAVQLAPIYEKMIHQLQIKNAVIVNISLHHSKLRQRGFDQTEILAREICALTGFEYKKLLVRQRRTAQQAKLDRVSRLKNMKNAFSALPAAAEDKQKNIILIDDVATTGATIDAAAAALQSAGYENIIAIVLAKNNIGD